MSFSNLQSYVRPAETFFSKDGNVILQSEAWCSFEGRTYRGTLRSWCWGDFLLARREGPTASGCNDAMENSHRKLEMFFCNVGKLFFLPIMSNPAFTLLKASTTEVKEQKNGADGRASWWIMLLWKDPPACRASPCDALLCSVAMATAEMPWQHFSQHSWTAHHSAGRHGYRSVSSFRCFVKNKTHLDLFASKLLKIFCFSLVSLHNYKEVNMLSIQM